MNDSIQPAARLEDLFPGLYRDLRDLAGLYLKRERPEHTLQPTDLVHEVFLKLDDHTLRTFNGKTHFMATAALIMRRLLVDHARQKGSAKRGGGWQRLDIEAWTGFTEDNIHHALAIDWILTELDQLDPRLSQLIQMKFFGGMTDAEISEEMGYTERWVRKHWKFAREWVQGRSEVLAEELGEGEFPAT